MAIKKIPYGTTGFPSTAKYLISEEVCTPPRQSEKEFSKYEGIDITYTFVDMTPVNFAKYSDQLLLLAFQEAKRYDRYQWKFARFDVRLGRMKKGKDLPEVASFQAAMHGDPDIMVYGPGYEVPQEYFLYNKVNDILDIVKRYIGKVSVQAPYKVLRMVVCIREPYGEE
jgi:hypothetical protein